MITYEHLCSKNLLKFVVITSGIQIVHTWADDKQLTDSEDAFTVILVSM